MPDAAFMQLALDEARRGLQLGCLPIGAVLVSADRIVGTAHWPGSAGGLLRHPERVVLDAADGELDWPRRSSATLYTTLEPCLMCMGTAMSFFLGRIVYAAPAPPDGASAVGQVWTPGLGHPGGPGAAYRVPAIAGGLMAAASRDLISTWLGTGVTGPEADYARQVLGPSSTPDSLVADTERNAG